MFVGMDTLNTWQQLAEWLNRERAARHDMSMRAVARAAKLSPSVISNMSNGAGPFSVKSLNAVADAFGVPREKVQEIAGMLPDYGEILPEAKAWSARLMSLSAENRANAIRVMEAGLAAVEGAAQTTRR